MAERLIYYTDAQPGIRREARGRGFTYIAADGTTIARGTERTRIEALAVPPAYVDVWICPLGNGHLQATGRDDRARKQYRYHELWAQEQARTKFEGLVEFGTLLPRIRRRMKRDLDEDPGERAFAVACAVALIDRFSMRVGNETYAEENGSYGAVSLRQRHVRLEGSEIHLDYTAKGGKQVSDVVSDKRLAGVLDEIGDLDGKELLTWIDDQGETRTVSSSQLNDYLAEASGSDTITAKTFRTWAGTLAAFEVAIEGGATIKAMSEASAERLHNTPTVSRNSYIHPAVIDLAGGDPLLIDPPDTRDLYIDERRLLSFLEGQSGGG